MPFWEKRFKWLKMNINTHFTKTQPTKDGTDKTAKAKNHGGQRDKSIDTQQSVSRHVQLQGQQTVEAIDNQITAACTNLPKTLPLGVLNTLTRQIQTGHHLINVLQIKLDKCLRFLTQCTVLSL